MTTLINNQTDWKNLVLDITYGSLFLPDDAKPEYEYFFLFALGIWFERVTVDY